MQEEYDSTTKAQAKDALISLCEEAEKLVGVIDYQRKQIELYKHHRAISDACLLYTSPSPRDRTRSRMPSSA